VLPHNDFTLTDICPRTHNGRPRTDTPPLKGVSCPLPLPLSNRGVSARQRARDERRAQVQQVRAALAAMLGASEASVSRRKPVVWTTPTPEALDAWVKKSLGELAVVAQSSIDRAFETDSVVGVLFCGVITEWSTTPSAYVYNWGHLMLPNPNLGDEMAAAMKTLDGLMFGPIE
jgi:hypothetical protein